jgi:hypothetical protein
VVDIPHKLHATHTAPESYSYDTWYTGGDVYYIVSRLSLFLFFSPGFIARLGHPLEIRFELKAILLSSWSATSTEMSSSANVNKNRQPRLRASCDGCFLAKVKCSKARPICSRCLACGIECRYSPSSRAGKPKADGIGSPKSNINNHQNENSIQDTHGLHPVVEDKTMSYGVPHTGPVFRIDHGWTTPPDSVNGSLSRNPSIATGLAMLGMDDGSMAERNHISAQPEMFANAMPPCTMPPGTIPGTIPTGAMPTSTMPPSSVPWTPPTDFSCAPYGDVMPATHIPAMHMRSQSLDMSMTNPLVWPDLSGHDMSAYNQSQTPISVASNYFPSPTATPTIRPATARNKTSPATLAGGSCTCFTVCLQSLQALHNASSPETPPFDLVLSLNRKAVEGCAAMLVCTKCMSRSGPHTAAMLLATVMGKISSFYKNVSHSSFDGAHTMLGGQGVNSPGGAFGVNTGTFQFNAEDGRWLELEILARELRKLEELYARFREVCTDLFSDEPEVSRAMICYLGQNLGTTLEVVGHRKGGVAFG